MKQLKITLNGKTVRTYRNDLHNSLSPKYHKPRQRPGYKAKYFNQMSNNKGLLVALGTTMFLGTSILVGCSMRVDGYKAEIGALQHELERTMVIAADNVDSYNKLESELASCSAKLQQKKLSTKAKAHIKQQPVVAEKIKKVFGSEWAEATELFSRESSLNPQAINPSSQACGLVQALPCSKLVNTCSLSDIDCQLEWGKNYIKNRYGSASIALAHSDEKGWY